MDFGQRLERIRNNMTQKDFAKMIGVPLTSYTNWVAGISSPKMESLILICSKLGVSADWLLGLSDEEERAEQENKKKLEGLKDAMRKLIDNY